MSDDERTQIVDTRLDSLSDATDTLETILGIEDYDHDIQAADTDGTVLERLAGLERQLAEIQSQLDAIQDLGREKTTKEEKVAAIVRFAQNAASNPTSERVVVKARQIKGVAGVSRRYAYDLIDDLSAEYAWVLDRDEVSQYGDLELDTSSQDRAVVVDLELLHSDEAAVNKFTTRTGQKGASA